MYHLSIYKLSVSIDTVFNTLASNPFIKTFMYLFGHISPNIMFTMKQNFGLRLVISILRFVGIRLLMCFELY